MANTDAEATGYGGFYLGGLSLALPMAALREVVPRGELGVLPCPAPCVIGAIDLRGVLVPVVDLRIALGRPAGPAAAYPSVIIMVHQGHILGLLADGVTGVFDCGPAGLSRAVSGDAISSLLAGSILRADDNTLVSVLSPAALAQLPQVPMVVDPEPGRQPASDDGVQTQISDSSRPMMLVRCGRMALAIDAMAVHATLADPKIERSVLALGDCRGVIAYAGVRIPVLDLLALSGLGRTDDDDCAQAFVMRLDAGMVAFLVGEVVDVVRTQPHDVIRLPAFALRRAALFAGALPTAALPADVVARTHTAATQYLVLDADALRACPAVQGLAATNTLADGSSAAGAADFAVNQAQTQTQAQGAGRCSMITYVLGGETATPIEQVAEILPYEPAAALFGDGGPLLGIVVNRGRSIPVMCLSQLTGAPPLELSALASVLVVRSGDELTGFAVPQLCTIEPADWTPEPADAQAGDGRGRISTRSLAKVGPAGTERLLQVLNLQQLAASLQAEALAG